MNYWLIKSEPSEFGLADLERQGSEPWTGVRNYQARNYMRDQMRIGDLALFYHSSVTVPGVVGIAQVGSAPYPDPTQFDPKSDYYDAKSTLEAPRWQLVDMHFVERFVCEVPLEELKGDPFFADMLVVKPGMRLSIQPVSAPHFLEIRARGRRL